MTTLDEALNSSATVLVVDTGAELDNGFRFRIDDEILTFLGYDRDSTADIIAWRGGDRTRWRVARGQDGTAAASHSGGATLYAVAEAVVTGSDLTAPDPFVTSEAGTPGLGEVLAVSRTTDGLAISGGPLPTTGSYGGDIAFGGGSNEPAVGGDITIGGGQGTADFAGGGVFLYAGGGDAGTDPGAFVELYGGDGAGNPGKVSLSTDGSTGTPGDVPVSDGTYLTYQAPVTGAAEIVISEDVAGGAGTYTGSVTVPAGATITRLLWTKVGPDFNASGFTGGFLIIGDDVDPDGFLTSTSLNNHTQGHTHDVFDAGESGAYAGDHVHWSHGYSDTDYDIIAVLTSDGGGGGSAPFLGEVRILVAWAKATPVTATFEAAP